MDQPSTMSVLGSNKEGPNLNVIASNALKVGHRIEVRYSKSRRFIGTIARANAEGTMFDVNFDDGEREEDVPVSLIHELEEKNLASPLDDSTKPALSKGDKIEAKFRGRGSRWYVGVISDVRRDGTFDIDYFDGDKDRGLAAEFIRLMAANGADVEHSKHKLTEFSNGSPSETFREAAALEPKVTIARKSDAVPVEIHISHDSCIDSESFEVGDRIEARYRGRGKRFYKGTIKAVLPGHKYDIDYDDGDKDHGLSADFIRSLPIPKSDPSAVEVCTLPQGNYLENNLKNEAGNKDDLKDITSEIEVGARVEAKFQGRGSRYYKGIVHSKHPDGMFDIQYDDGDFDQALPSEAIRLLPDPIEPESSATTGNACYPPMDVGRKIEARYKGSTPFFPGTISRVNVDGTYDVVFHNGENEKNVPSKSIKTDQSGLDVPKFMAGDRVECKYRGAGSKWYKGTIHRSLPMDKYDIHYDDGDRDFKLSVDFIRPLHIPDTIDKKVAFNEAGDTLESRIDEETLKSSESVFSKGDKVEAKFRGRGHRWFKGTVSARLPNGSYNIRYDDGDADLRLPASAVRAQSRPSTGGAKISPRDDSAFSEGAKVEVRYRGKSKYYPGVIRKARPSGTFDIYYDDGEREVGVKPELIKAADIEKEADEEILSPVGNLVEESENEDDGNDSPRRSDRKGTSKSKFVDAEDGVVSCPHNISREEKIPEDIDNGSESREPSDDHTRFGKDEANLSPRTRRGSDRYGQPLNSPAVYHGKGNRLYRGTVSKVKVVYLYEVEYPDGSRDVNIPFGALKVENGVQASDVKVGASVDVLSWQDRFLCLNIDEGI